MSMNTLSKRVNKPSKRGQDKKVHVNDAQYTYSDMLTLRPPPSDLERSVPRPKRGELPWGLPLWNKKPLNSKLPLMKGPDGHIVFSRGKLGEKLWRGSRNSKFQLKDPYGHDVRFSYEASHDPHLKHYLRQPLHVDHLLAQDMITDLWDVKCTVEQYNMFRQFLYDQYSDALRQMTEYRENMKTEQLMIRKAEEIENNDVAKLKKLEDTNSKRVSNLKKLDMLKMERLENCKRRLQRVLDRAEKAEKKRESDLVLRKQRVEAFNERIRSRIENANHVARQRKIKAMRGWHKQDVQKKKLFEQREIQRENDNKKKAEERWKRKVEEQKKQIAKEEFLHNQRKLMMEENREQYMKNMEKAWSRLEDELNRRKCSNTLHKVKVDKRNKSIKQIMQSVSDAYALRKSTMILSRDEDSLRTLIERIQQTLKEIRYDLEPYIVIAHAKERLEKQENVPLPVSGAIKYLLEQSIVEYTATQLSGTMNHFTRKVLSAIDEIKNPPAQADGKSLSIQTVSLTTTSRRQSEASGKITRISQLASHVEVIPVEKTADEFAVPIDELRSAKDRPPTPMYSWSSDSNSDLISSSSTGHPSGENNSYESNPNGRENGGGQYSWPSECRGQPSIATLTEVLFKEGDEEEFDEESTGEYPFIEQKKLNLIISGISHRIMKMIPSRVRAVVQSRSYDRISTVSSDVNESLPENKPMARLCHMILCEDQINDHLITSIVDRIILGFMQDLELTPSYLRIKMKQNMEGK